jgi:arylsulfatase A-like enzyme
MERGFETIYFRSIDVSGHVALSFRYGAKIPAGCPPSLRDVTDAVYVQIDTWIGRVLDALPRPATVVIVSDHGMTPGNNAMGTHAPSGILIAAGDGIRNSGILRGASVLDVAPTLLYLLDSAIPLSMDGKLLVQILEPSTLEEHPPAYRDMDTTLAPHQPTDVEGSDEVLDELRSLGYIK